MKNKIVKKTSIFPASKNKIFNLLQEFEILQKIARPYISFKPIPYKEKFLWKENEIFKFKTKLLGFIPFGVHTIKVVHFNNERIYTREKNTHVPIWNHEIILKELDNNKTSYTDIVEINAKWMTYFVYLWARLFYTHRQKKWIKILNEVHK